MECATCGLAPCDLPDGVDPEMVFERGEDRQYRCQACRAVLSVDFLQVIEEQQRVEGLYDRPLRWAWP